MEPTCNDNWAYPVNDSGPVAIDPTVSVILRDEDSGIAPAVVDLSDLSPLDYQASAELYPLQRRNSGRPSVGFRRFASTAEAIQFAIEVLPSNCLLGTWLQVENERFDSKGIRRLYDHGRYPLPRLAMPVSRLPCADSPSR